MIGLDSRSLIERARSARLVRVLLVYVFAGGGVLEVIGLLVEQFGLPPWFFPASVALLLIGLPIIAGTALIQAGPRIDRGLHGIELPEEQPRAPWTAPRHWFTWKRAILGGVLAFVGLGSLGMGIVWLRNRGRVLQPDVVAVLPFHVVGTGVELWREGLVDLLGTALDATGQFRSSDPRAVLNRWRHMVGDEEELPEPGRAADVVGSLGAGRMILGSVIATGPNQVRVAADLYSVRWLRKEGSAAVEGPEDEMTSLVDRLTVDLLKSVWQGDQVPEVRVSAITTSSLPALRAYLEGEQAFRRSQFNDAQNAFARAVEADSTFAIALYRLALTHGWQGGLGGEFQKYLGAAARHSGGLPERDSLLILAWKLADIDGDLEAIRVFQRLSVRYPDDLEAWYGLGEAYFHIGSQVGHARSRSIEPFERALALDSTFAPALIHPLEIAYLEGDSTRGRSWTNDYLALDSTSFYAQGFRLLTPLQFGPPEDSTFAAQALDTASTELLGWTLSRLQGPGSNLPLYEMALLAAADPRHEANRDHAMWDLGLAYLRHGQVTLALAAIKQALSLSAGDRDGDALHVLSTARVAGLTVDSASDRLLDRLSQRLPDEVPAELAAYQGRLAEARAGVTDIDSDADNIMAAGDSTLGRSLQGLAWLLRGHIAAASDSVDAAIDHLRRGLSMVNALWSWSRDTSRYSLASLIQDRGSEDEALRIYGSLYQTPWLEALGYLRRAQLHERRGEREEALRYYARFAKLWANADSHLQPQVQSARRAMERLAAERATS